MAPTAHAVGYSLTPPTGLAQPLGPHRCCRDSESFPRDGSPQIPSLRPCQTRYVRSSGFASRKLRAGLSFREAKDQGLFRREDPARVPCRQGMRYAASHSTRIPARRGHRRGSGGSWAGTVSVAVHPESRDRAALGTVQVVGPTLHINSECDASPPHARSERWMGALALALCAVPVKCWCLGWALGGVPFSRACPAIRSFPTGRGGWTRGPGSRGFRGGA